MSKISITRALVEVKTLDERINNAIRATTFVSLAKGRGKNMKPIQGQFKDVAEVEDAIKSSTQSVEDMITRRSAIKAAIAVANVTTKLKIAGKEVSIVEAIDMKHVIGYRKAVMATMMAQIKVASNNIEQARKTTEDSVQAAIERLLGADVKNRDAVAQNAALIESTKDAILDMQELSLVDPIDVKAKITKLSNDIAEVENEIDFALSEINAKTEIEV